MKLFINIWEEITYDLRQRSQFHILSVHSVFSATEIFKPLKESREI